jgi:hypothetical protein
MPPKKEKKEMIAVNMLTLVNKLDEPPSGCPESWTRIFVTFPRCINTQKAKPNGNMTIPILLYLCGRRNTIKQTIG